MIGGVTGPFATSAKPVSADEQLRESAKALEGLFVQQLFKAMRETVPQQDGIVSGGAGEDIFTSLMDQHLAAETPNQWAGGLGEALYRQLRGALPPAAPQASTPDPVATAS
ncbi:MAG: rod-binding protein [Gemmatimonadetes bacterium]|nr:rod-binding protein [Gemmatimonadota bacterium]